MLRKVKVEDAVGLALAHDLTKIVPGQFKGAAFKRGHVIREEDILELLKLGKDYVYVLKLEEGQIHEDEAALRIAKAVSGKGIEFSEPSEGKVSLKSMTRGILKIKIDLLEKVNSLGEIMLATLHNNTLCEKGLVVGGTRIIPLFTSKKRIEEIEMLTERKGKVFEVLPYKKKKVGLVTTGNEVFYRRIEDKSEGVFRRKIEAFGSEMGGKIIVPDDVDCIAKAIRDLSFKDHKVIIVVAGLSVDPDDVTLEGVKASGAEIISYGAPVLPGAMFLVAMLEDIPILGTPACTIFHEITIFDLIFPRILAEERITRKDIVSLGHGGLCLHCTTCRFPICPFGK